MVEETKSIWLITNRDIHKSAYDTRHMTEHQDLYDYILDRNRATPPLLWAEVMRENAKEDMNVEHFLHHWIQRTGKEDPTNEELCKAARANWRSGSFENDKAHLITQALPTVPVQTTEFVEWSNNHNFNIVTEYQGLHY